MAKKPQRRPPKITEQKREEMFQAFCEKQSMEYVARKCGVNPITVGRYLEKDNWLERLQKIREKAAKKADTEAVERRARHINLAKLLQTKGAKFLMNDDPIVQDGVAVQAIATGVRIEREAAGEPGETSQQKFVIEVVRGDSNQGNPDQAG